MSDMEHRVEVVEALAAQTKAEIDSQVATAKQYPRVMRQVLSEAMTMATYSEEVAQSCWYSVPRAGKRIEGPSVRLAEIMVAAYGNMRAQTRVVSEDERFIVAQAAVHDLEKNTAVMVETRRRITDKEGNRYNDDMIAVTANAARAIALRDAVFRVIPRTFVEQILGEARKTAVGDAKTFVSRRDAMLTHFNKLGVDADRVCASVDRASIDDLTADDLVKLRGTANAIKDGEITIEEAFPEITSQDATDPADRIRAAVAAQRQADAAHTQPEQTARSRRRRNATPNPSPTITAEDLSALDDATPIRH